MIFSSKSSCVFQSSPPPKRRCCGLFRAGLHGSGDFQSSPPPKRRCCGLGAPAHAALAHRLSILTASEEAVLYPMKARVRNEAEAFNPHRLRRGGAVVQLCGMAAEQLPFNPHRLRRGGAVHVVLRGGERVRFFQSSPPPKRRCCRARHNSLSGRDLQARFRRSGIARVARRVE